jgi:hypothetical protein
VAEMVLAETVPEYSPIEDALNELGKDLHKKRCQQKWSSRSIPVNLSLTS